MYSLKQRKNEVNKEKEDEVANLTQQLNDTKRQLARIKQERDEYHRKVNDAIHYEEEIHQRDQMISELQDQIARLNKEVIEILQSRREGESRYIETSPDVRRTVQDSSPNIKQSTSDYRSTKITHDQPKQKSEIDKLKEKIAELSNENKNLKTQMESIHQSV